MESFLGKIITEDATLVYRRLGRGDPVVLIHGSLDGMDSFKRQYPQLGRRFSVVSLSRRFHPPSTPAPARGVYSLHQHVEDLYTTIRELPERVRSLVLGEPPMLRLLDRAPEGRRAFEEFQRMAIGPARNSFQQGDIEGGARKFVDGIRGEKGAFDAMPQGAREKLVEFAPELRLELTTDLDTFMPDIMCEQLQKITVPTLLLTGEQSPALFHMIIDQLERCIPETSRVEIPRAGHAMHIGNADAYNRAIMGFLVECCPGNA
jgi:pimeloyl-ACP methyl ester carboxylesterase